MTIYKYREKINFLNKATKAYDEGKPFITDKEWDDIYFEVDQFEKESGIIFPDSPTQTINYEVVSKLQKITHNHEMLSLDKTKDWNEFISYFGDHGMVCMCKMDGLTCSLLYENGSLVSAETRGNGQVGEDVTHNAKVISSIPQKIPYKDRLVIDGEIICTYDNFKQFENEYANPRNFASGSIRLLDSEECSHRNLTFVVWNVVDGLETITSVIDRFNIIQKYGFIIVPWTSDYALDADKFLVEEAKRHGYPIDGLVGRFDDIQYGQSLGSTGHHSKAAYAFKFYDDEYKTHLLNIEWSMGRTGILTPVAVFEPIDDGESVIEKASLHNISIMYETLGCPYKNQTIYVAKMNQIIPQIVSANIPEECDIDDKILVPDKCPICGGRAIIQESDSGVKTLVCEEPQCQGKLINQINHYCSKKGLDIKGLSEATLEKLIDWNWLTSILDLYYLKNYREAWINKPGFGEKSVDKILTAIEESKNTNFISFISALGIPLIGQNVAAELNKHIKTYEEFREKVKSKFDFSIYGGFAENKTNSLLNFNYDEADKIYDLIHVSDTIPQSDSNLEQSLKDKTIVITGTLHNFKNREEFGKYIKDRGGKVGSSISKNTFCLVNNDFNSTSTKNNQAKKFGINILTEDEFCKRYN